MKFSIKQLHYLRKYGTVKAKISKPINAKVKQGSKRKREYRNFSESPERYNRIVQRLKFKEHKLLYRGANEKQSKNIYSRKYKGKFNSK